MTDEPQPDDTLDTDEPELTDEDLAGRSEESCKLEDHVNLCDDK